MKRYAIVRVDNTCPFNTEDFSREQIDDMFNCHNECEDCNNYGDTKEQFEKKVAQVIFRRRLKLYKKIWGSEMGSIERKDIYEQCLNCAKEIVEFLGVEDDLKRNIK